MIKLSDGGVFLVNGTIVSGKTADEQIKKITGRNISKEEARQGTITHSILAAHNKNTHPEHLNISFDCLASHDLTYVGVIQTAKASGLKQFPVPYVLTNCHNSLCAVGGTLNEDDHLFGFTAAQKYGGIFVPPHQAVIHSYMREMYASSGSMILGSDSHTRYGALGTMGIGEGGGELVKQLLGKTYDIDYPPVVCVYLRGKCKPGVGPQDIALAIIGAVFNNGYVKNKVMEFTGDGLAHLSADTRNSIDIMTTETSCLSSIWETDDVTRNFFSCLGRPDAYTHLKPAGTVWYDGLIEVNLSEIEPMIALPFHPSNVHTIKFFNENTCDILRETEKEALRLIPEAGKTYNLTKKTVNGKTRADQGIIAGCAGGSRENIMAAGKIIKQGTLGSDAFSLSIYPESQPVMLDLVRSGIWADLAGSGAVLRSSFCGPCFGAGDIPANNQFSIRHTTRNFPNREGSKPRDGQIASVALMDSRSIAASAINGGFITPATDICTEYQYPEYVFDPSSYRTRVYNGFGKPNTEVSIAYGPNIADWPKIDALAENLLLGFASVIHDSVTTTDELIPSGDASTYRSNPLRMAQFTLSRKDPEYVKRTALFETLEKKRRAGEALSEIDDILKKAAAVNNAEGKEAQASIANTGIGSVIYAVKPGDGSAREQAASCQRVLGGCANIAREYATKRYRSNLINWGILPFTFNAESTFTPKDYLFIPNIRSTLEKDCREIPAYHITPEHTIHPLTLTLDEITAEERNILLAGCLINYYREQLCK